MAVGFHLLKNVLDLAVGADDESGPRHAHHFFAVHILFLHHTVEIANGLIGVGDEGEGQIVFIRKLLLRLHRVGGYAQNNGAGFSNLLERFAEPARFDGSAWRIGPRIKVKHDPLGLVVLQRDLVAVLVERSKVRGFIINFDGDFHE